MKIMKTGGLLKMEMYIMRTGIEKYSGMKKRWIDLVDLWWDRGDENVWSRGRSRNWIQERL
jgi:acid phosphatase class B